MKTIHFPILLLVAVLWHQIPHPARAQSEPQQNCLEFGEPDEAQNPRVYDWVVLEVKDFAGNPLPQTRVTAAGDVVGLDLGFHTVIELRPPCATVEMWLAHFSSPAMVEAFDADGHLVDSKTMTAEQHVVQSLVLSAGDVLISHVSVHANQDETLLIGICGASEPTPTGLWSRRVDDAVMVEWTGEGILQSSTTVFGPWTDVPDAISPYPASSAEVARFFRLRMPREDRVVEPEQGVEIMQVNFGGHFPDSGWGRVVVDPGILFRSTGIEGGYLNVFTTKGWAIQNLPVPPLDQPPSAKYFDLGEPELSEDLTTVELKVVHSNGPIGEAAVVVAEFDFYRFPVPGWIWNPSGLGPEIDLVPGPPPPTVPLDQVVPIFEATFARYQPVTNVETAKNQCWPMAVANCLQFLEDQGDISVPHNHTLGLRGDNTLVGKLDTAFDRTASARCVGDGVCVQQAFDGKFKYLSDNNVTGLSFRHQGVGALCEILPAGNYSNHGITSQYDGAALTWEWIRDRMSEGWAIEAIIVWGGGGGHAVRVTGYGMKTGSPWIRYSHDAQQCNDTTGLEHVVVELTDPDNDQLPNLDSTNNEFVLFIATGI